MNELTEHQKAIILEALREYDAKLIQQENREMRNLHDRREIRTIIEIVRKEVK